MLDALLAAFLIILLALGARYSPSAARDLTGSTPALVQATLGDALVLARQTGATSSATALGTIADTGATVTIANIANANESLWTTYAGRPFSAPLASPVHIAVVPFAVASVLGETPPTAVFLSPSGVIALPPAGWTTTQTIGTTGTVPCPTASPAIVLIGASARSYTVPVACSSFGGVAP